jgi:hypothetical protein
MTWLKAPSAPHTRHSLFAPLVKPQLRMSFSTKARRALEGADLSEPPTDAELTFYTHTQCPYAARVWITLLEKVTMRTCLASVAEI